MLNKEKANMIVDTVNNSSEGVTHGPPANTDVTRRTAETQLTGVRDVL